MPSADGKPFVLFVCRHNTGRSQMAEVASAGTIAADRPDPGVVAVMAEVDMDISRALPKLIDPSTIARANRIITMGCDVEGVPRIDDDWGLPDPKGKSVERVREIRDLVCSKAADLAKKLVGVRHKSDTYEPKRIGCGETARQRSDGGRRTPAGRLRRTRRRPLPRVSGFDLVAIPLDDRGRAQLRCR